MGRSWENDFSAFRVRMFHKSVTATARDNESVRCTCEEEEDK